MLSSLGFTHCCFCTISASDPKVGKGNSVLGGLPRVCRPHFESYYSMMVGAAMGMVFYYKQSRYSGPFGLRHARGMEILCENQRRMID